MPSKDTSSLAGRVVAVTGAGRGIGRAIAAEAHRRGATVVLGDIDEAAVTATAAELGDRAHAAALDVSDPDAFAAFADVVAEAGPLDVLVNNAGVMPIGPFLSMPAGTHRRAVEINVLGCINGTRAFLPALLRQGRGHVVNVASTAAKAPVPGGATYCATKAAVAAFTETLRVEYAGSGVWFSCVLPHFTNTELIAGTSSTRGVGVVEPGDVAAAVCDALARPRPDVFVPRVMRPLLGTQPLLGRRIRDAVNRRLGAYRAFLDVDQDARAHYDDRVARS